MPGRAWLLLKRVWTHSFQVHETTFFSAEQIKMEKHMGLRFRDVGVLFPKPVSQGPVWFVEQLEVPVTDKNGIILEPSGACVASFIQDQQLPLKD